MAEFVDVLLGVDDLEDGEMRAFVVGGKRILVAGVGGDFLAADNACPHLKGSLADGKLEGSVVTCPRHGSRFDLRDGRALRWTDWNGAKLSLARALKPPRPLKLYHTKVEDARVLVERA